MEDQLGSVSLSKSTSVERISPIITFTQRIDDCNDILSKETNVISNISDNLFGSQEEGIEKSSDTPESMGQVGFLDITIARLELQIQFLCCEILRLKNNI